MSIFEWILWMCGVWIVFGMGFACGMVMVTSAIEKEEKEHG